MKNFLRKQLSETLSWLLITNHQIPCGMKHGILLLLHIRETFKLSQKKETSPYSKLYQNKVCKVHKGHSHNASKHFTASKS